MSNWLQQVIAAVESQLVPQRREAPKTVKLRHATWIADGWYGIKTAGHPIHTEEFLDLRLADSTDSYKVISTVQSTDELRVHVGVHAPRTGLSLWGTYRPSGFLVRSLRDALAGLSSPGLATQLADGRVDSIPMESPVIAGLDAAQSRAHLACVSPGVHLVWGPPGTGKTRVLATAINSLLSDGKRVLLLSGTNIAVDNALEGVLAQRDVAVGEVVRVGTAHVADIASNPKVSVDLLIRARLGELNRQREAIERELLQRLEPVPVVAEKPSLFRTLVNRLFPAKDPPVESNAELQSRHEEILAELARQGAEIEPVIVAEARLVATTLTRLRLHRTVYDGHYDMVLIDEAGASPLPEILLAASKARHGVTMLGDFCQLGAIEPRHLPAPAAQARWLTQDCFQLAGIHSPADALAHPGCASLITTYRFGPSLVELANRIAYAGTLRTGLDRARATEDPEVVVVTTDGLEPLNVVQKPSSGFGRWWTIGSIVSHALAEKHRALGETVGIVSPYRAQFAATRDFLDDLGALEGTPTIEVGTAHSIQGREFDVVILDLVEDGDRPGWTAKGDFHSRQSGRRNGARLLNVGITRARHRAYVITSWSSLRQAAPGSPLAAVGEMANSRLISGVRAARLLGVAPRDGPTANTGIEQELTDAFAAHVLVEGLYDEHTYYPSAIRAIDAAQHSIWLWSPWFGQRMDSVLPHLTAARDRGVNVTVFVVDEQDSLIRLQRSSRPTQYRHRLSTLHSGVTQLVRIRAMHQKVLVVDGEVTFLGSLNILSGGQRREIMVAHRGRRYAHAVLEHLHAERFARPPSCPGHGIPMEVRRSSSAKRGLGWYWACPTRECRERRSTGTTRAA